MTNARAKDITPVEAEALDIISGDVALASYQTHEVFMNWETTGQSL